MRAVKAKLPGISTPVYPAEKLALPHILGSNTKGSPTGHVSRSLEAMTKLSHVRQRRSAVQRLKDRVPWYAKIAGKIVLSRLPISYSLWRRTSLFRHGAMDVPQRALEAMRGAMAASGLGDHLDGLSVLELGPGDSLSTALISHALGAHQVVLIDTAAFATQDIAAYHRLAVLLEAEGASLASAKSAPDVRALLDAVNGRYMIQGLKSLERLEPDSIDFSFSNAVLEHIRAREFVPMMHALRRVMKPTGLSFHNIDLQDHLAYALNNLRFSDRIWESAFMAGSGFYTNRIGYGEMLAVFRESGFETEVLEVRRFTHLPTPRASMAPRFRDRAEDDLLVCGFTVVLKPV